jgi:hypothetical protein
MSLTDYCRKMPSSNSKQVMNTPILGGILFMRLLKNTEEVRIKVSRAVRVDF